MANMLSERAVREIHALRNQFEAFLMNDETGERVIEARKFLAQRPCWTTKAIATVRRRPKTWATIQIGTDCTAELDLVVLTTKELGVNRGALKKVCSRALDLGFELSPSDVNQAELLRVCQVLTGGFVHIPVQGPEQDPFVLHLSLDRRGFYQRQFSREMIRDNELLVFVNPRK